MNPKTIKIIYYLIFASGMMGCEMLDMFKNPSASFTASSYEVEPGDEITFTNYSVEADIYEWDFGDGNTSREISPVHVFEAPGTFQVTLKAITHGKSSTESQTIEVKKTSGTEMVLYVYMKDTENPVEGCRVDLYATYDDWLEDTNILQTEITDAAGFVSFPELEPVEYYISAFKDLGNDYLVNWFLGIKSPVLTENETNTFSIYVNYFSAGGKSSSMKQIPVRLSDINK